MENILLRRGVNGDKLLDTLDTISDVLRVNGIIDNKGYITLYHATNKESAIKIIKEQCFLAKEDSVFMSTCSNKQIKGYGDTILKIKVPAELLILDDDFGDELHYRIYIGSMKKISFKIVML